MKVKKNKGYTQSGQYDDEFENNHSNSTKWYQEISSDPKKFPAVTDQVLIELKDEAKKCLDSETATYNIKNQKSNKNYRWMKTIMSKGTISDKIAAYTLAIQDNPVYNLSTISNLVSMVKVGKKTECITIIETLSELFLSDLLRPNEKLRSFHQRPLSMLSEISSGNAITRRKYLSYWYFEDQLREAYTAFVMALNAAAHDSVETNKEKAIAAMARLLEGNPEQEKNLLKHIVNKMGDPSQKVASKTMYCLTQLLRKHSNMQGVVLAEFEKLLFRQNVGHKAQYYSLCFLSQFLLNHDSPNVARKLIDLYFSFFKKSIKEGDLDSRMMSVLLIGVNRAYPYAKLEMEKMNEHIDTMYRVVHTSSFNIGIHALTLLYQVSEYSNNVNDRYYSALYRKLLDPKIGTTTNQSILLNLIYKSLLRDKELDRVQAFIKRLLQICLSLSPNFACGILYLISQILTKKKDANLLVLLKSEPVFEEEDEEKYVDADRVNNLEGTESNESIITENHSDQTSSTESIDVKKEELQEDMNEIKEESNPEKTIMNALRSWYHCKSNNNLHGKKNQYDPLSRNPLYAGSKYTAYVELNELKKHFHPSVALFAEKIFKNEMIVYTGDPLKDFTLIRFLDRFVFKNPKKSSESSNETNSMFGKRNNYVARGIKSLHVLSNNYLEQQKSKIPVEEAFMYSYLQKRYRERKPDEDGNESDADSVASEEFNDMLSKMSAFKDVAEDVDYLNDIGESIKKTKRKRQEEENEDESEEEGISEDDMDENEENDVSEDDTDVENEDLSGDDLEMNEDDEELFKDLDDDDEESEIEFNESDDDTPKKGNKKSKKNEKVNSSSLFASAEEFSSLLEDEGVSKKAPGGSGQFSNKDKANVKQLDWEEKRNNWIQGYKKAVGGKSFKRNNKRSFGKNQTPNNKRHKKFK